MSPTSYQAAPPRVNVIYNRSTLGECQERIQEMRNSECGMRNINESFHPARADNPPSGEVVKELNPLKASKRKAAGKA